MPRYTIYVGDDHNSELKKLYKHCDISDISDDGIAITCRSGNIYRFVDDDSMVVTIMIRTDKKRRYMYSSSLNLDQMLKLYGLNEDITKIKDMILM